MAYGWKPTPPAHILVVEDGLVNQQLVARVLEREGHRCATANNRREALAHLEHERFDLMLVDGQRPVTDGFELATRVRRETGPNQRVPMVALTANATGPIELCSLACGTHNHATKPIKLDTLVSSVEEHLAADRRRRAAWSRASLIARRSGVPARASSAAALLARGAPICSNGRPSSPR